MDNKEQINIDINKRPGTECPTTPLHIKSKPEELKALTIAFSEMSESFIELSEQVHSVNISMDAFAKASPSLRVRIVRILRQFCGKER